MKLIVLLSDLKEIILFLYFLLLSAQYSYVGFHLLNFNCYSAINSFYLIIQLNSEFKVFIALISSFHFLTLLIPIYYLIYLPSFQRIYPFSLKYSNSSSLN